MKTFIRKIITWGKAHKIMSAVILLALVGGTYGMVKAFNNETGETRYVLGTVERGTIVASVSASGQVSASNQVDITSSVSGDVLSVPVKAGDTVKSGALIARIDSGDAAYELETARISYDKLTTIDPTELRDAQNALKDARSDLEDAYTSARAALVKASTDMNDILVDLDDLRGNYVSLTNHPGASRSGREYITRASDAYWEVDAAIQKLAQRFRELSSKTEKSDIDAMVSDTYEAAVSLAQTAKYMQDAVVYFRENESNASAADEAYTAVIDSVAAANSVVSDMGTAKNTVTTNTRALETAQNTLSDLQDGPDVLDLRSEELSVRQKEDALAKYSIRAPFDATIATLDVQKGDTLNSNSAVATLITNQKIAELSLNEVDVAKINVGNRATLTFDAVEGLTLTGEIAQIDTIGTVEQGVVSYTVKVEFTTQDERIKPGMTVNASIQMAVKQDVLYVPSSAVKTQNNTNFVQVFDPALQDTGGTQGITTVSTPTQVEVETGISDDTNIEIVSGLTEGQQIVVRTTTGATSGATASTNTGNRNGFGGSPGTVIRF